MIATGGVPEILYDPMDGSPPGSSVMGFSRQEYWSGLPFPSPGDLPDPGIKPRSPTLQADTLTSEPPGKPFNLAWGQNCSNTLICVLSTHYQSVFQLDGKLHKARIVLDLLSKKDWAYGGSSINSLKWDFPGGPEVKIPCSWSQGHRFNPLSGTKIPYTIWNSIHHMGWPKGKNSPIPVHFTSLIPLYLLLRARIPQKKWSSHHGQQKSPKCSTWMQSQKREWPLFVSKANHSISW